MKLTIHRNEADTVHVQRPVQFEHRSSNRSVDLLVALQYVCDWAVIALLRDSHPLHSFPTTAMLGAQLVQTELTRKLLQLWTARQNNICQMNHIDSRNNHTQKSSIASLT